MYHDHQISLVDLIQPQKYISFDIVRCVFSGYTVCIRTTTICVAFDPYIRKTLRIEVSDRLLHLASREY